MGSGRESVGGAAVVCCNQL
ncbi:unnamed protein product [Linum tenue]|uniref:Uncharacterized protein n=1 Tax=Linum tenue TaxID=586396 RepID=A0AAV0IHX3_9ROSI|nr:unnamed protein product [Linum tenue]